MRSTYKIKRGDTLGAIARSLGTTVKKLAELNGIKDPNKIKAGASLKLPVAARQKFMEIQRKESGALLSQKPFEAASAKQKAAGGTGGVVSKKARKGPKKAVSTPTPPPSGRKTKKKMYTAINTRTGKPDRDAPKVTAAQRLKQEDEYKKFKKDSAKFRADATREYISRTAKKNMNKGGAALKPIPAGNKGLKKLPTPVRNRMGFMRKGGVAKKK